MNAQQQARMQRRWVLEQRSAELRERLAGHSAALAPVFTWADRARRGGRWVQQHPLVPVGLGLLLLWRRPRRLLRWGGRAWALWGTVQKARGWWRDWRGKRGQAGNQGT